MGVPSVTKYGLDIFNVILFLLALSKRKSLSNYDKYFILCYISILVMGTISFIVNIKSTGSNIAYFIFDIRNLLRFVMFFFSCKMLINKQNIVKIYRVILGLHFMNCILVIYQFFTLEVDIYWMRGDNLNGFFGVKTGGNIYLNALLIATTVIALEMWKTWEKSPQIAFLFMLLNIVIATLVELKGFYVEIAIILIVYFAEYIKKLTAKRICIIMFVFLVCAIGMIFLIRLLYKLYPWMQGSMSSIIGMINATKSTTGSSTISRISFMGDVYNKIFKEDIVSAIFGYGIGSANINGTMTDLARTYYSTHYSWLSSAYMLVEVGFVGLMIYFISFIVLLIGIVKKSYMKKCGISICLCSLFCVIYNETFKTDAGYFLILLISISTSIDKKIRIENSYMI